MNSSIYRLGVRASRCDRARSRVRLELCCSPRWLANLDILDFLHYVAQDPWRTTHDRAFQIDQIVEQAH